MARILIISLLLLSTLSVKAQSETCGPNIPDLCDPGPFPASTSDNLPVAPGANYGCLGSQQSPAFFTFKPSVNGPFNVIISPTNQATGLPAGNDLDFICWGPFTNPATMCNQLTAINEVDCSFSGASIETCNIANAVAGQIYVIMVANYSFLGGGNPCNLNFNPSAPFSCCQFAGNDNTVNICDTDPPFDLFSVLNNSPASGGIWEDQFGNSVNNIFDPSIDPAGTYNYIIAGNTNCIADTGFVTINLATTPTLSITSQLTECSANTPIVLTGSPIGGTFSGLNVTAPNLFTPNTIGLNTITYTYNTPIPNSPNSCTSTISEDILVIESPTVTSQIITPPACPGEASGSAIITAGNGTPPYSFNWYGEDPLALTQGTFNYTITDSNSCTFNGNITIYDPNVSNPIFIANSSSCYGANDGSMIISTNLPVTPPGTISTFAYCASSPNSGAFASTPSAIIESVKLNGDNNNINNSTPGVADFYEDYTTTMYADLTEGQAYTIGVTLNGLGAAGSTQNYSGAKVYIDYNIDGDFTDPGEEVGIIPYNNAATIGTSATINFIVPTTGVYGPTRMRVVSQYLGGVNPNPSVIGPCDFAGSGFSTPWYGATEDYSIVLKTPISCAITWAHTTVTDSIVTNLSPGFYTGIVTYNTGCIFIDSAEVLEPEELFFNAAITPIACNNTSGQISISPSGGNGGPYNTNWGTTNPLAVNAGTHVVTIEDISTITTSNLIACNKDTTIILTDPAYFSVDFTTSTNEICLNEPVTLDFNFNQGGVPPFTINYTVNSNAQTNGPINSSGITNIPINPAVGSNTYVITSIIDDNGCSNQNIISPQFIDVNTLPDIDLTVTPNPICTGENATILFSPLATGTPPYIVDYTSNGTNMSENVPGSGLNITVNPNTDETYVLNHVTDSKGCESNLTDSVTLIVNEYPQANITIPNENCDGEVTQIQFNFTSGAAPWDVNYSTNGISTTVNISNPTGSISINPSSQTNYTIESITDDKNCTTNLNQSLSISINPLPEIILSGGGSICNDGSTADITFKINSGTPPYTVNYSVGLLNNIASGLGNSYTFPTNTSGVYSIQNVTDNKGCKAVSISGNAYVNINPIPEANITAYPQSTTIKNPMINFIDISNGHSNGIWSFDDGNTSITNFNQLTHTYLDTGIYNVYLAIESDSGCKDTAWQTIMIYSDFTIYIPNAFTPNNDLYNDYFIPIVEGVAEYEFNVYDRLGTRIFRTNDYTNDYLSCVNNMCSAAWDGKINNGTEYAAKGTYIYSLVLTDINGKIRTYEGSLILIR